jgi:hypothetical protein
VVRQEKVVNNIQKLVVQYKIYFPFNLRVKFGMRNKTNRLMLNCIHQLLACINCVILFCKNINTKKNVEMSFVSRKKNGLELNGETRVSATSSTERMRKKKKKKNIYKFLKCEKCTYLGVILR